MISRKWPNTLACASSCSPVRPSASSPASFFRRASFDAAWLWRFCILRRRISDSSSSSLSAKRLLGHPRPGWTPASASARRSSSSSSHVRCFPSAMLSILAFVACTCSSRRLLCSSAACLASARTPLTPVCGPLCADTPAWLPCPRPCSSSDKASSSDVVGDVGRSGEETPSALPRR